MDYHGNIKASEKNYMSSQEGIFVADDMRSGQSLVVWAIREGRESAEAVANYLQTC